MNNKNIADMPSDFLYHLGILIENTKDTSNIEKQFGDVKVSRALKNAYQTQSGVFQTLLNSSI